MVNYISELYPTKTEKSGRRIHNPGLLSYIQEQIDNHLFPFKTSMMSKGNTESSSKKGDGLGSYLKWASIGGIPPFVLGGIIAYRMHLSPGPEVGWRPELGLVILIPTLIGASIGVLYNYFKRRR